MNPVLQAMPRAIATRAHAVETKAVLRLGSGLGVLALVALAQPAFAANECGVATSGTVTCPASGNPYPNGVSYPVVTDDLTIVLNGDTVINTSGTINPGVSSVTAGTPMITVDAAAGSSVTTDGALASGYLLGAGSGGINATTGTVRTSGLDATGIAAIGTTGAVTVVARDTATTGANADGILGVTTSGALTVTSGTVSTSGLDANGVNATSTSGNVLVNGGTIGTSGNGALGVIAQTGGAGNATIQGGTITTTGSGAIGAAALAADGAALVNATSVTTSGAAAHGVVAVAASGTAQAGATTISTTGAGALGAVASGLDGSTVNYGSITTTGAGSTGVLVPAGGATATVTGAPTGLLSTTGASADGILVTADQGVSVNVGRVSATGAGSRGIIATGGTAVGVTARGVTGNADAITATSTGGAVNATLSGATNSTTGSGAVLTGATTANFSLASGGNLDGAINGATITSGTGTIVNNAGTIDGTNAALVVTGGPATINNNSTGTINGRVLLTGGADTVNNAGTFNADTVSDFGAGNDVFNNSGTFNANSASTNFGAGADTFNNSGTLNVLPNAGVAGTVTMTGLETFNNNGGLIDLRNGHTGDVLALPGTFNGSGASALAVDVWLDPAPTASDRLQLGGTASGGTEIIFNRLDTGPAILSTAAGTTVVQAGGASNANAFYIGQASAVDGMIQYGIVYDPGTFSYNLVSAPSSAAYRTALFGDGVRNLWLQSGDAWSAHMRELRDNISANGPGGAGGRFWFQGFGQWEKRTNARTVSYNGITSNVDLSYDQDYFGVQLGMDLGTPAGDEGGFNFGVTGGYQNSMMSFPNTADRIKFNAINGGLYANYTSGILFANVLGKYDYYWGNNVSPAGNYSARVDGSVWGAKAEIGLRFGQDFFVEPAVSLSWTNSDFDDLGVPSGNFAINDEEGLRGRAGARFGYVTDWGNSRVSLYGGANYVREFRGRSDVVFTSGGQSVAFRSPHNDDYVEGVLGVNVGSQAGKISGFFEGRYADGSDYEGYGVRGGMRVRF